MDGRGNCVANVALDLFIDSSVSSMNPIFMVVMPMLMPIQASQMFLRVALTQGRARDIDRQLFEPGWASDMQGKL